MAIWGSESLAGDNPDKLRLQEVAGFCCHGTIMCSTSYNRTPFRECWATRHCVLAHWHYINTVVEPPFAIYLSPFKYDRERFIAGNIGGLVTSVHKRHLSLLLQSWLLSAVDQAMATSIYHNANREEQSEHSFWWCEVGFCRVVPFANDLAWGLGPLLFVKPLIGHALNTHLCHKNTSCNCTCHAQGLSGPGPQGKVDLTPASQCRRWK